MYVFVLSNVIDTVPNPSSAFVVCEAITSPPFTTHTSKCGTDVAIIANGLLTYEAIKAGEELAAAGINAMVINMPTIKPLDEELVLAAAKKCGKIITCEEHSVIGGLGEAVCSYLAENCPTIVKRIGVNDEFGHSGPAGALLKQFGLSAEHIVEVAKELCK